MTTIKTLTKQVYEKKQKSPNEIVFYKTEKDICNIISTHLVKNLKENLEIVEKFLSLSKEPEVYEAENNGKTLYIIKASY